MNNVELENLQLKVLERFEQLLKEQEMKVILKKKGEDELETNVLGLLLTDVSEDGGEIPYEFFFYPRGNDPETVQYFVATANVAPEVGNDELATVCHYLAVLNYYLPVGAFTIDYSDSEVVYKLTTPISGTLSEEELFNTLNIAIANTIELTRSHFGFINSLASGEATEDDVIDFIGELSK